MTKVEQKKLTHETILGSAARLLRSRGISGARVADVMSGAGLTVGGFYAHFGSKKELIDETIRRTSMALREQLFAGIEDEPATERVLVALKRYLSSHHRDGSATSCPFPAIVGEISTTAPEHRDMLADQLKATVGSFQHHLAAGQARFPRTIALGLVALMYGGLSLARALRGSELSDEILRACRAVGTLIVRGELEAIARDPEHDDRGDTSDAGAAELMS
jgi:TetR/AcrR family transcriptional repressor of nem operon